MMKQQITIWLTAIIFAGVWGCVPNTRSPDQPQTVMPDTINVPVEETVPNAFPSEQSQGSTADTPDTIVDKLLDGMRYPKPGPGLEQTVAALAQQGDNAVAEMEQRLVDGDVDFGWRHDVVRVLRAINTEKSRALLRRLALGEFGEENAGWATTNLLACDQSEAVNLLVSTNPAVLSNALNKMKGHPIDDRLMELLKKCLRFKSETERPLLVYSVQRQAALLMAAETSEELAKEAVEAIGEALNDVADLPDVDTLTLQSHSTEATWGERYYGGYIHALMTAKVEDSVISDLAKQLEGRAKDVAILALARRGDKSVREEIIRLVQDTEAGLFRAWAARNLGEIGMQDDLPFLHTLVENDPLVRMGAVTLPSSRGPGDVSIVPTYPVREAARDAILAIAARANKEESDK